MNNTFQILDKDGNAIPINQLDREVCELQGKEYDPKWYCGFADPSKYEDLNCIDYIYKEMSSNWHDTLGRLISNEGFSFEGMIEYYEGVMKDYVGKKDENGVVLTIDMIYPRRIPLIRHWIEKGYKTKQIVRE
jgi:hypothetical protein